MKPRSVRLLALPSPATPGAMEVASGDTRDVYLFAEGPAPDPDSRLFEVIGYRPQEAFTSPVRRYQCLVMPPGQDGKARGQCTCPDQSFRGGVCKHVAALSALAKREEI